MKGLVKLLLGLVALIVVLTGAAGVLLGALFDPNDYKTEISQLAEEKAGVSLQINGDINWSVFPWLGLELNQVRARFGDQPELAVLNQVQLAVRLPALLERRLEMQSIVVDGLQLNLVQQDETRNNWTPVSAPAQTTPAQTTPARTTTSADSTVINNTASNNTDSNSTGSSPAVPPLELAIESTAVTNAKLSFEDQRSGQRIRLTDLQLETGKVVLDEQIPLQLQFTAFQFDGEKASNQLQAKLTTDLLLDMTRQRYQLGNLNSILTITAAALDNNSLQLTLNSDITADLNRQIVLLDQLRVSLANLDLSGDLALENFATPRISGQLALATFDLNQLLQQLGQPAVVTTDPQALKALSLSTRLGGTANMLDLRQLVLKLDDTTFNGALAYGLTNGKLNLSLAGDRLDIDRYLPPKPEQTAAGESTPADTGTAAQPMQPWSKAPLLPVDTLQSLALKAELKLAALKAGNMEMQNLALQVTADRGLIQVSKINLDMYGGTVRNRVTVDARKTPLTIRTRKDIRNIQIGDLLQATAQTDTLSGTLSSTSDLTTRGNSMHAIMNSLSGQASFRMKDGEVRGLDMAQTICQGMNTVGALGVNVQDVDRSTPFADMSASTVITNGKVQNNDLNANLDSLQLRGNGNVNLPQQSLNYRLGLTINDNLFKKTCRIPGKIEDVEWPVDCKGRFDTPPAELCKPDLGVFEDILKAKAQARVQEKLDEEKAKIKEKLTEKLSEKLGGEDAAKQLLRGLFGQ
ncbi:MAG: AsmA family protein [Marinobacterium sp.]|nr:AsmA family protein [Marinobacterium sp.]